MHISYRVDYGVRIMATIAEMCGTDPRRAVPRSELARSSGIASSFLTDILGQLRQAELLHSQRGTGGGWWLARPGDSITVAEVIRAVDGPIVLVRGFRPHELPAHDDSAVYTALWITVRAALRTVLEDVTIQDLASGSLPTRLAAIAADRDAWDPRSPV